ncbi:P pilus assembly protein, chaperone PapD [Desulfuromusa kysingii]|uniref:P pilus assembly protein, chaperone PapD n=1 Tax=Desulfuromusa kysingii TaxID=37625 RepID=A0A1H3WDX2_9BACT|nr:DUF1573 domain-containing protein [Desulfuromusa kysingii]SDZ85170.1 P pilus assembly protein, chaperone PapD [Desulfuromusa kysingii]
MRAYCLLLLLLLLSTPVFAAPELVVEGLNHDFGEIKQGGEVAHTFRFRNAGDEILNISNLHSSCGCTAALLTTRKLAPGAIGELQLIFNSQGFRGEVQKMVTFETNDPKHPAITFNLRGKVKAELFLQPERINWGLVKKGATLQTEVEIVNRSKQSITLQQPQITSDQIYAELSARIIAPGEQVRLTVSAKFPDGKKRLAGYVVINSDFTTLPQLKIPVSARLSQK